MITLNQLVYDPAFKCYTSKEILVNPRYIVFAEQRLQSVYANGAVQPAHTFIIMNGCEIYHNQIDVLESVGYIATIIAKAGL